MTLPIYFGTILIEPNRWGSREPSFRVSDWLPRLREAGFDGVELWENHALRADEAERQRLIDADPPLVLFSTYDRGEDETAEQRQRVAALIRRLGIGGMKFNVGGDADRREEYLRNLCRWTTDLPVGFRMLCECHGGTILEDPAEALRAFEEVEVMPAFAAAGPRRIEAIVHFAASPDKLHHWFTVLGDRITHIHVAKIRGGNKETGERLDRRPEEGRARLDVLRRHGFAGTFTLEFTEGVQRDQSSDEIETLYEHALADLAFLRDQMHDW